MPDYLRDELLRNIETLRQEMLRGFDGTHDRLDKQNGRIGKLEQHQHADFTRLQLVEASIARWLPEMEWKPGQTRKQLAVTLSLGAGGGMVLIEVLKWVLRGLHG